MLKYISLYAMLISLCMLSACQSFTHSEAMQQESKADMALLSGEVLYRERIILQKGATLKVSLVNTSQQDIKAEVISQGHSVLNSAPPYAFSLHYDKNKIRPNDTYSLQARIEVEGKLRFISTEAINPFSPDNANPSIIVKAVGLSANTQAMEKPITIVSINPTADLENSYWKLVELAGKAVVTADGQKQAHVQLSAEKKQARGFSSCNQFQGGYTIENTNRLQFDAMALTLRMCAEQQETEQGFMQALAKTAFYAINDKQLRLYSTEKKLLAVFDVVYF